MLIYDIISLFYVVEADAFRESLKHCMLFCHFSLMHTMLLA